MPGDHVVLAPDSDGTCEQCASGEPTYCERFLELNFQTGTDRRTARLADGRRASIKSFGQSSFAHYAVAGERSVVKVHKDLPLRVLGPLGCSVQTGAGTVMNGLRPPPGSSIAILGRLARAGTASVRSVRPLPSIPRHQSRRRGSAQWPRDKADSRSQRRMRTS